MHVLGHSYLSALQPKPTGKCVPSGLEGSKSHSATQEQQSTLYWLKQPTFLKKITVFQCYFTVLTRAIGSHFHLNLSF